MMKPQLLSETNDISIFIENDDYSLSQKIDGKRLIAGKIDDKIVSFSRSGLESSLPVEIKKAFNSIKSEWLFDGELVKTQYHVFDIIKYPGGFLNTLHWIERQKLLSTVLRDFSQYVNIVPQMHERDSKLSHYENCKKILAEGVVACHKESPYQAGIRSKRCFKFKFVKTIDCVVIDCMSNGKDNITLGLYDNNELIDVGKTSSLTGDGKKNRINIGDVVTVKYLYGTKNKRLYQPVFPKIRKDKKPRECLMNQMILKTEKVL